MYEFPVGFVAPPHLRQYIALYAVAARYQMFCLVLVGMPRPLQIEIWYCASVEIHEERKRNDRLKKLAMHSLFSVVNVSIIC